MWPDYIVIYTDQDGREIEVPVNKEIFDFLVEADRCEMRIQRMMHQHHEHFEMDDLLLYNRCAASRENPVEEGFIRREDLKTVMAVLLECSEVQRRRFCMYYFDEMTCKMIAKKEGCINQAVSKSLNQVMRRLRAEMVGQE